VARSAAAQDSDADGIPDASDNCVYVSNPLQEDAGGLLGSIPDGVGDACQCGDLNDDGEVDLLDAALYQRGLAGVLPVALGEDKCSVIGGRLDCEPNDRQALRQALVDLDPGVDQVCQAANAIPPLPNRLAAAGDSITQGFAADCTCNAGPLGLFCLVCPALGDQTEYSWFDGDALGTSFYDLYGGSGSGITSQRVSVSGAEMTASANGFSSQVDDILSLVPIPDLVVVELGGNDVCNRGCVDPGSCSDPLYDDATWTAAIEAGLDKLVGFGQAASLPPGSTVYLLGVPRVQDLHDAGVEKQMASDDIDCESFWDEFDVCRIATVDVPLNGEDLPTRRAAIALRIQRYNEILRDLALAYSTNANGRNPNGIEVVADYVNEVVASIGTTSFGANEINGGDCFHPSPAGQALISAGAWFSNPR
jgi:lysophospholipase L1-like esterase